MLQFVAIQSLELFCAANRAAFKQALNCTKRRLGFREHHTGSQLDMRFAKGGGFAGIAAPPLDFALAAVPKSLAGLMLTAFACHGVLSFLARQAVQKSVWVGRHCGLSGVSIAPFFR
jgi:hypothetical protein